MNIGFVYAIAAAITWGLVYTIDQKILSSISPMNLLFIDSIITAIIMAPFVFAGGHPISAFFSSGKITIKLMILSILLAALASYFIFASIKSLNAEEASAIEIAYPFFVVLFSFIFFRTVPNIYFAIGSILVFIGSAIIIKFG